MHVTLSAKVKLVTTPTQAELLRKTAQAYRDALNYTSQVADEQGTISNTARLQPLV
jgi:putative transposase